MRTILDTIAEIKGTLGAAAVDANGRVVLSTMPATLGPTVLADVTRDLQREAAALTGLGAGDAAQAMMLGFERGCLAARFVGGFTLLALGAPGINPTLLGLGLNVAASKLTQAVREGRIQGVRPTDVPSSPAAPAPTAAARPASAPVAAPAGGGGGGSSDEVLEALTRALARHIGPFAKLTVRNEAGRLGLPGRAATRAELETLVTALARAIKDGQKEMQFRAEVAPLLAR